MHRPLYSRGAFQRPLGRRISGRQSLLILRRHQKQLKTMKLSSKPSESTTWEVEQKFSLTDNFDSVESRLRGEGFAVSSSTSTSGAAAEAAVEMTDWYFDCAALVLARHDHWLRYRENKSKGGGQWELKRGSQRSSNSNTTTPDGTATIYEELEGSEAMQAVASLLLENKNKKKKPFPPKISPEGMSYYQNHDERDSIPSLPQFLEEYALEPFARIFTRRTSWTVPKPPPAPDRQLNDNDNTDRFKNLSVDLDTTDDGYGVGEVEALVDKEEDVAQARSLVQELVATLCCRNGDDGIGDDGSSIVAASKIEYFLQTMRPEVYQAFVDCGIFSQQTEE